MSEKDRKIFIQILQTKKLSRYKKLVVNAGNTREKPNLKQVYLYYTRAGLFLGSYM